MLSSSVIQKKRNTSKRSRNWSNKTYQWSRTIRIRTAHISQHPRNNKDLLEQGQKQELRDLMLLVGHILLVVLVKNPIEKRGNCPIHANELYFLNYRMEPKKEQPAEKTPASKLPIQRPPMGNPKMPMNNHRKASKPGGNFTKPVRTMRASKGR